MGGVTCCVVAVLAQLYQLVFIRRADSVNMIGILVSSPSAATAVT